MKADGEILEELKKKCLVFAKGAKKHGKSEEAEYYRKLYENFEKTFI